MTRRLFIICLIFISSLPFSRMSLADENAQTEATTNPAPAPVDPAPVLTTQQVQDAIEQLQSPEFAVRQKSMETLQAVNAEQIELLTQAIQNSPENEVAQRCVELLERRYASDDRDSTVVRQASEVLEAAANSDRWFVAEAARDSLERHWKRRVEIAILELQKLGASMSPKDPEKLWEGNDDSGWSNRQDPTRDDHLKIFVDEYWDTGPRGFELLHRLSSLVSRDFLAGASRVSMYIIDGHPLQQEELAELKAIFGDIRVSERGRVCLGISNQPQDAGQNGVEVNNVTRDSSADKAAILPHDVLLKFEGKPLKDFDELIGLLKAFRVGDEVTFQVQRYGVRSTLDIKVKLQGWYER